MADIDHRAVMLQRYVRLDDLREALGWDALLQAAHLLTAQVAGIYLRQVNGHLPSSAFLAISQHSCAEKYGISNCPVIGA